MAQKAVTNGRCLKTTQRSIFDAPQQDPSSGSIRCNPPRGVGDATFLHGAHMSEDVIAGDQLYTALDPDGFLFGVISSSMFITWQRTVGGRMKSDLRFSNKIVWNTLSLPEVSDKQRATIIAAGQGVLEARAKQPGVSLADM